LAGAHRTSGGPGGPLLGPPRNQSGSGAVSGPPSP
jgi:hypothetical protein